MNVALDAVEARVMGSLLEKAVTTPDQYPLSLNALVNACNQKTNREPVMELPAAEVLAALERLSRRHLVMDRSGFGSRVVKYQHRLCNGEHNPRQFSPPEVAIVCELLLRGPQTPGELRARGQRLAPFPDVGAVDATLAALAARPDGPYVMQLPRAPGARESRWRELFTQETAAAPARVASAATAPAPPPAPTALEARVAALEAKLEALTLEVARRGPGA